MSGAGRAQGKAQHALFRRFPLQGSVTLSTGEAPTPYHVYDGRAVMIGGIADWNAVRRMLGNEDMVPVRDSDGNALMAIWLCDFTQASLGPHHELQFSFLVSRKEVAPIASHRLGVVTALLTRPDVMMLCSGLWNDTPDAVAYNCELLGLDARLSKSHIRYDDGRVSFEVADRATGAMVLAGHSMVPRSTEAHVGWHLTRAVGFFELLRLSRQPYLHTPVIKPAGVGLMENRVAETFSGSDISRIRYYDAGKDQLNWGQTPYASLGFQAHFINWLDGFRMVYLTPDKD